MINIFILNWNSVESVNNCLNSVLASDYKIYRVILINNFSTELDLFELSKVYDQYKEKIEIYLVENNLNLGYAGGNNSGLDFLLRNNFLGDILILNPDVIISENTISEMNKALIEGIGIVTVRTLDTKGKILFDAIKLKGFQQKNIITDKNKIYTDYSQGSCLMIKRDIINRIGLFDERFFLYWEEVDFSLRVIAQGEKLLSITTTHITKKDNSLTRQPIVFYYSVRNASLIKNNHPNSFSNVDYIYYLIKTFLLTLKYIFKPKFYKLILSNYLIALYDSFHKNYYSKTIS
jgi:GT2 family glycosyltransferase